MRNLRYGFIALFTFAATAVAAEVATIHLLDGSKLTGEVTSLKGGVYTIETRSMGVVNVPQSNIRVVEFSTSQTPTSQNTTNQSVDSGALTSLQTKMLNDPSVMSLILSLKDQPEIQALMSDPDVQTALASGNYLILMDHPKMKALLNNRDVQKIVMQMQ